MNEVKLTEYSHGAGCGCKIAPNILETIIKSDKEQSFPNLLVGYHTNDDAAAYDLGNGTSVLSTTDFFMPIVDDPYTFGRIAATNAISDIYAMGGKPLMAISILGWPINVLPADIARRVVDGGRDTCLEAGIPLAGGHSIDSPEPIYGLAVTGIVDNKHLKRNNQAEPDCELFLTKPLGIGILTTAQKRKKIEANHIDVAIETMMTLNKIGGEISSIEGVVALTDVTGFGLIGHLTEICKGSDVSATIQFDRVPVLPNTIKYMEMGCVSGGTKNNMKHFESMIDVQNEVHKTILCDAQTSGGLLVVVRKESVNEFLTKTKASGLSIQSIGYTRIKDDKWIKVI